MNDRSLLSTAALKRLLACLAGAFVLALMIGKQEGTQDDYGYAFRQAIFSPRIVIFIAIGVVAWLAITFWPWVVPFLQRSGVRPLAVGVISVIVSMVLLKWYDPIGDGKFNTLADAVSSSPGISGLASAFFAWLAWTQLAVVVVLIAVAVAYELRPVAWVAAGLSVVAGIIALLAHNQVVDFAANSTPDHSLGAWVSLLGYLVIASAAATVALSKEQVADSRAFVDRALAWRPGLPLIAVGLVAGVLAFTISAWFSPQNLNATFVDTHDLLAGQGIASITWQYLSWLGYVLLVAAVVVTGAGAYLRNTVLSLVGAVVGVIAVLLTLQTLYNVSDFGAQSNFNGATGAWQNLGSGGWLACIAFSLIAAGGLIAATTKPVTAEEKQAIAVSATTGQRVRRRLRLFGGSPTTGTLICIALAIALFYPPTATQFWQTVLVSEIGIYVLLAVGLNVVVGWAGLLDLGFIAFYAIGSYTTAYLVGSLPVKPPSWLQMSPLLAIPFAIVICLIAGIALGAPTLRLRGDYLAIVTLGFGEIIRIVAINNPGNITNSTRGPSPQVPHPVVDLGFVRIKWDLNQLQYWYLLLFFTLIVVILFYRLEGSRIGRAWAAIREDEIAAQATGINTTRVKLLAFAIGASTSGLAGVLFASQVGYFNPDNFVLNNSILVVAYVVFGGMGSLPGAIAGAAVLTWLPEFLKDQVPAEDRQMWIGAVLLIMMIFRPGGLIPAKRRKAELEGLDTAPTSEVSAVPSGEGLGARS